MSNPVASFLRIPFQRQPLSWHSLLAGLTVLVLLACAWLTTRHFDTNLAIGNARLTSLQQEKSMLSQGMANQQSRGNFIQGLPPITNADDVVRDMSRHAQTMGIQVMALSVVTSEPSVSELRKMQFNLAASGDYRSIKNWLAELLGRYPSLAVQTLAIRGMANDAARQEAQMVLVLFVKD